MRWIAGTCSWHRMQSSVWETERFKGFWGRVVQSPCGSWEGGFYHGQWKTHSNHQLGHCGRNEECKKHFIFWPALQDLMCSTRWGDLQLVPMWSSRAVLVGSSCESWSSPLPWLFRSPSFRNVMFVESNDNQSWYYWTALTELIHGDQVNLSVLCLVE